MSLRLAEESQIHPLLSEGLVKTREAQTLTRRGLSRRFDGHRGAGGTQRGVHGQAQQVAERVTTALGGWGLFGVELFICGEEVLFSEVSPRPHDTGLVTLASQRLSEFELHARALLGLPVDTALRSPGASVTIKATGESAPGEGVRFAGLDEALAQEGVDLRLFGKPEAHPGRRLGVVVASADDVEVARDRARSAAQAIRPSV